ncbi:hypothetical protein AXF42_Ash006640 [Apostasia shenzhenica]|uniref:Uncharacterized protein n=1 Tax=Apostasia shenzhenica TaxID=1088818 RepID=A0A2I0AIR9_9ASPA|nr:hypothetical protein AXF42_Ash006640 [Apostasia shenzhenica]
MQLCTKQNFELIFKGLECKERGVIVMMKERERLKEREMRGVGGPLLCIDDLLSDVADNGSAGGDRR